MEERSMTRHSLGIWILLATTFAFAGKGIAQSATTEVPGAVCRLVNSSSYGYTSIQSTYYGTMLINFTGQNVYASCPIAMENKQYFSYSAFSVYGNTNMGSCTLNVNDASYGSFTSYAMTCGSWGGGRVCTKAMSWSGTSAGGAEIRCGMGINSSLWFLEAVHTN
jgi:hypothetical protein